MMPFGGEYDMIWKEFPRVINVFLYIVQIQKLVFKSSQFWFGNDQLSASLIYSGNVSCSNKSDELTDCQTRSDI